MATKILRIPYYSQLDNDSDYNSGWWNECSYSSMAIFLASVGYVGNGNGQFDDQLEKEYEARGLRRGAPENMRDFMSERFIALEMANYFTYSGTMDKVKESINCGYPVLVHTYLTRSGHVAVIVGYDDDAYMGRGALVYHDPNGEWSPTGYIKGSTGKNVKYSYSSSRHTLGRDGDIWMHTIAPLPSVA